jgi:hypothetical protein
MKAVKDALGAITPRRTAIAVAAAAALGLLGLLYDKSQAARPGMRAEVQDDLRLVNQLDSDWNVGVMSAKVGLNESYDPLVVPAQRIAAALARVERSQAAQGAGLAAELDALRRAFAQKTDLVDNFKSHNSILRNSMRYLRRRPATRCWPCAAPTRRARRRWPRPSPRAWTMRRATPSSPRRRSSASWSRRSRAWRNCFAPGRTPAPRATRRRSTSTTRAPCCGR